ncbi:MAG: hypothetical protein QXJ06_00665 [Candidatus Aenigmatarchaeota archaeon]
MPKKTEKTRVYSKSKYTRGYHIKHLGTRIISFLVALFYFLDTKQELDAKSIIQMAIFILINLIGFKISINGSKELAYSKKNIGKII